MAANKGSAAAVAAGAKTTKKGKGKTKFAEIAQEDAALAPEGAVNQMSEKPKGMSVLGKAAIFLVLPTMTGIVGLYTGYLASLRDPKREMKFDTDFALPFVLALSMAIVIGFQTQGYTLKKVEPLVAWPKVRKRKRIVHKHVVIGGDEKASGELKPELKPATQKKVD
jgi:hypothetical protein